MRFLWVIGLVLGVAACGPSARELKQQQERAKYHYDLAYGYYFDTTNSNANAAMAEVLKSLDIDEENADAHLLAGLILMGREDCVQAVDHYKRALELRPLFHYAKNNLGACYLQMGRWDDAMPLFQDLIQDDTYRRPGHAHNNLGWAFYKKGDSENALKQFRYATLQSPDLCQPYNNMALIYLDQRDVEQAEKYIERGIKRCPAYAEAYQQRARVRIQQRRPADARSDLRVCMKLSGDAPLHDKCKALLRSLGA